jgi:hypothetical protein
MLGLLERQQQQAPWLLRLLLLLLLLLLVLPMPCALWGAVLVWVVWQGCRRCWCACFCCAWLQVWQLMLLQDPCCCCCRLHCRKGPLLTLTSAAAVA